jgi:hypothetical protein
MVFDHRSSIDASPEQIWPWLVQLGKRRAGWYLPAGLERMLPERRRAARRLDPRFQELGVGDRIPDYGGADAWLEVARLEPPHTLLYTSQRRGRSFTWALLLSQVGPGRTELRLRFRGEVRSQGISRRLIVGAGGFFDWATGALMVRGLRERVTGRA